jgi:SAM-dependent methyltransferase
MNTPDLSFSPAAERNKQPILAALQAWLPANARVLEIASGTGQHAAHFAASQPHWSWQPSDHPSQDLTSIGGRCADLGNVRPPLALDVLASPWPAGLGDFEAVYCANMLHISPWETTPALMRGAADHLVPDGLLVLYGPYLIEGEPTAPGNLAFDADLRSRHPAWGLRWLHDVTREAQKAGFVARANLAMPANNRLLVFQHRAQADAA